MLAMCAGARAEIVDLEGLGICLANVELLMQQSMLQLIFLVERRTYCVIDHNG